MGQLEKNQNVTSFSLWTTMYFTSLLVASWIPCASLNLKPVLKYQTLQRAASVAGIMGNELAAKSGHNTVLSMCQCGF